MQRARWVVVALAAVLGLAAPAAGQIAPLAQDRSVEVQIGAYIDCAFFSCPSPGTPPFLPEIPASLYDSDSATAPDFGPFDATVARNGFPDCLFCNAAATATQSSSIGADRIDVSASLDASGTSLIGDTTGGNPLVIGVGSEASSHTEVRFSVGRASHFVLSGSFAAPMEGYTTDPSDFVAVLWQGQPDSGAFVAYANQSCLFSCPEQPFSQEGDLAPGVYTLVVTADSSSAAGGYGPGNTEPRSYDAAAQLEASLVVTGPSPVPVPAAWILVAAGALLASARRPLRRRARA